MQPSSERRAAPAQRKITRRRIIVVVLLCLLLGLSLRLAIVASYRAPAGDGLVYYALSQSLVRHGRLAMGGAPAPLLYTRLPGYPLFLSHVAIRTPTSLSEHLRAGTQWNAVLDTLTALLVLLLLRELGFGPGVGILGALLVFLCPQLMLLSCYGLSESLATFLSTLCLWLLARAARGGLLRYASLCGAVTGYGMLVRADMVSLVPIALLVFATTAAPGRRRIQAAVLYGLCAGLVLAPWCLRNLHHFGAPYPTGAHWSGQDGQPMPEEPLRWVYSWSYGNPSDGYLMYLLANSFLLHPERKHVIKPEMYDDEAERQRLVKLFERYNRERLTPVVRAEFAALAVERARRSPLRHYLLRPLGRLRTLWSPIPEPDLPMTSRLLHQPERRAWFGYFHWALFALAAAAALLLLRAGPAGKRAAFLLGGLFVVRSALLSVAHPIPNGRYLVEAFPGLLALCATLPHALRRRWPRP